MFAISIPSSADAMSIEERGVRLRGLKRLLRFDTAAEASEDASGIGGGGARGSVGGRRL